MCIFWAPFVYKFHTSTRSYFLIFDKRVGDQVWLLLPLVPSISLYNNNYPWLFLIWKKDVCHNLQMAPFDSTFFMFFPIVILPRYYVLVWSSSKPFTKTLFLIVVDALTTFVKVWSNHRRVRLQKFA